mgnify:CR=1 FL=1
MQIVIQPARGGVDDVDWAALEDYLRRGAEKPGPRAERLQAFFPANRVPAVGEQLVWACVAGARTIRARMRSADRHRVVVSESDGIEPVARILAETDLGARCGLACQEAAQTPGLWST